MRTLLILLTGQAMAVMDGSILAVAAPSLRTSLDASDAELQLVVGMYTIAFAALVVTGARIGDVIGRRRAFLVGLTGFTLASLAGGLAPNPTILIAVRAMQGVAAALMTPQVLSIIQLQYTGETRARAVGAYSFILAVGVAAGQILGGALVSADVLGAAWRPALLLNAPIGVLLLLGARRGLRDPGVANPRRLDLAGATLLTGALLALVLPLTFGRDSGWPAWVWPSFAACGAALAAFAVVERRVRARGRAPLFDLDVLRLPGVAAGVAAVLLIMASYSGFLISLTLHLQNSLGFSPFEAGLVFACYASGFGAASLAWTRLGAGVRRRLPIAGPLVMAAGVGAIGLIASGGAWPVLATAPVLVVAGVGHACGYSPLATWLTTAVRAAQAGDLSGLVITGSMVGNVIGIAAFTGIYLSAGAHDSAHGLAVTTAVLGGVLVLTALCAARALVPTRAAGAVPAESHA
ncbi:MAG TPA: MFS transporter [Thermoleophilaceae bacterium]|jgi:MFS family permease